MTEQEWLAATDPTALVRFLLEPVFKGGEVSDRKLRLAAVACCRRIWHSMTRGKKAVEIAEAYADGRATQIELEEVYQTTCGVFMQCAEEAALVAARNTSWITQADLVSAARYAAGAVAWRATNDDRYEGLVDRGVLYRDEERKQQVLLVQDIFGNPFHPVTRNRIWLTPTVTGVARAVYDERQLPSGHFDNQRMGVLADALEEAGCDDADVLGHLRSGGEHVRGCWPVDLLLGKK